MNIKFLTALGALGLGLAACSSNGGSVRLDPQPPVAPGGGGSTTKFVQIERLSRPAIKEVFENFVDHATSNALEPYDPNDRLKTDIVATEDFVRYGTAGPGTGPDYGKVIQSVVYPDEYLVDLAQSTGGFLGTETAKNFGGRNIDDDVIGAELGVLFGTTVSDLGLAAADNKQNNCLKVQNLGLNPAQKSIAAFPYLPTPR